VSTVGLHAELGPAGVEEREQLVPAEADAASRSGGRLGARHRLHAALALGDAAGVLLATLVVAWLGPWRPTGTSVATWVGFTAATAAVILVVLAARGSYASAARRVAPRVADDLGNLVAGLVAAGVCLLAMDTLGAFRTWVPPEEVALVLLAAALIVPIFREVVLLVASHNPANVSRLVIVGGGSIAQYLTVRLSRTRLVDVVGLVDDTPGAAAGAGREAAGANRFLGTLEDLPALCARERIDRILVAFSGRHPERVAAVLQELRGAADIDIVVRYYELAGWESRLSDVTGLSLLSIGQSAGPVAAFAKRALDVVAAAFALALLSPLLGLIALAVWLDSGRPILFRQVRIGRHRRPFPILKFRTMHHAARARTPGGDARAGPEARPAPMPPVALHEIQAASQAVRGSSPRRGASTAAGLAPLPAGASEGCRPWPRTPLDSTPDVSRITKVGGFLRRLGLDELPQLVNVLRGDMSLVGPRPFIPEECESLHGSVERRFDVRPGMTGLWQVCGQHEVGFDELCRLDVQYGTSWSLRGDLRILARTPARLFHGSSATRG
jgi:exopolysaccharide biosynthesis polyprenyl glycosylphosphotransferase